MSKPGIETEGQQRFHALIEQTASERAALLDRDDPQVSLPSDLGKLAIVVSGAPGSVKLGYDKEEHEYLIDVAEGLAEEKASLHGGVEVRHRANLDELKAFFRDPEVSDITLIGHGSISRLWLDSGAKDFHWLDAARAATRLKAGTVEQRTCGHFGCVYTVPLGTFAVTQLSNVKAALGQIIPREGAADESLFTPVLNDSDDVLKQIDELNSKYMGMVVGDQGELITGKEYYKTHNRKPCSTPG